MKLPVFLDPKRADEADVLQAYEEHLSFLRSLANWPEIEVLCAEANKIRRELDLTSEKKKAKRRVLQARLRRINGRIKEWLRSNGMK